MIEKIQKALQKRAKIKAWNIRHVRRSEHQQYDLQEGTEACRAAVDEHYLVDVLRENHSGEDGITVGLGSASLLEGGNVDKAVNQAWNTAGLVHNPPYEFPLPAEPPDVSLADQKLVDSPREILAAVVSELKEATGNYPGVRLSAAEVFGNKVKTHLVSSRGIDVEQTATNLYLQWAFLAGEGDAAVESFVELSRRRLEDLDLISEVARRARYTLDLIHAGPPESYQGPVVVREGALAEMIDSALIRNLSSADLKYSGETPWQLGKSIAREELHGDPFHCWANRALPYGTRSSAFDSEGLPARRVELVRDHVLTAFWAGKRYADYLDLPATGAFGNLEVAPGSAPADELLGEPHVEITEFSWFNPNPITGDFACEIRLGYTSRQGERMPFKGGLLIGNLLDALADVRWSSETGFYGSYSGPTTARFHALQVAGRN